MIEYPDATCQACGSEAAIRIPASQAGYLYDFILCYKCGNVSVVEPAGEMETFINRIGS